jgi:hypothetical protein
MIGNFSVFILCVVLAHLLITVHGGPVCDEPMTDDVSVRKCCRMPKLCGENTAFQCRHLAPGGQKVVNIKAGDQPDTCLIECMFRVLGAVNNGTINREALRQKYTTNAGGDRDLIVVVNAAIDGCVGEDGQLLDTAKPPTMAKTECDANPALVFSCVYRQIFLVSLNII